MNVLRPPAQSRSHIQQWLRVSFMVCLQLGWLVALILLMNDNVRLHSSIPVAGISDFDALTAMMTFVDNNTTTTTVSSSTFSVSTKLPAPPIAVFVIMSPAHGSYWERFYENSNGWQAQFPDLRFFTFDQLDSNNPLAGIVESLALMENEETGRNSNLLLASFQRIWEHNNKSNWYFMAEDDTILVKDSLERYVATMDPSKPIMKGKCAIVDGGKVKFAMGGAGILMSRALLRDLYPHVSTCRQQFNKRFGDVRIGNCIKNYISTDIGPICAGGGFLFPGSPDNIKNLNSKMGKSLVVTMHEKEPLRIKRLNEVIKNISNKNEPVSVDSLLEHKEYWDVNMSSIPRTTVLDCGCPWSCTAAALEKSSKAFKCRDRINYLMETYNIQEREACSAVVKQEDPPCGAECDPNECKAPTVA